MNLAIGLVIAAAGGFVGMKLGLPQGALLGSILAVAIVNALGLVQIPSVPKPLLFVMYILIGLELGSGVNRQTIGALSKAWIPTVLFVVFLMAATVVMALVINRFFGLDLATAVFGTAPGAVSGITAMGGNVGANVPVVVAMHTLRVTVIVYAVPFIYGLLTK